MVSTVTINALGIVGGVILAICQVPQLVKLYRTRSAADLSYVYLLLYSIGLLFITIYLYLEGATVGWICECIETVCGFLLIVAKYYLDQWGPLSWRAKKRKAAEAAAAEEDAEDGGGKDKGEGSADGSGSSRGSGSGRGDGKGAPAAKRPERENDVALHAL